MNHDALNINLGQYGYVEMESPTIVADSTTYYVGLSFYNTFGSAPGNRITIYLDDVQIGTMYTSGGTPPSRFKKDPKPEEWIAIPKVDQSKPENNEYIVGEVTFETTGKHKLRIEEIFTSTIFCSLLKNKSDEKYEKNSILSSPCCLRSVGLQ